MLIRYRKRKWKKKEDSLLLTYTETIGGMRGRTRRENPLYPVSFWNVKKGVDEDFPRTNNAVEGFHSALRSSITCKILMSGNLLVHSKKKNYNKPK